MKDFVMIFRNSGDPAVMMSPDEMQEIMQDWQNWMGSLAAQNLLVSPGSRLGFEGKTVKANHVVTDGPFAEIKEMVSGFIIVRAQTVDEAANIAKDCPIFKAGGSVEVRAIIPMMG
jgi:hypothetical protein